MPYNVIVEKAVQKQLARLAKLDKALFESLSLKLLSLSADPRPPGCKKLKGRDAWRIRDGNYSIIYTINDGNLEVLVIELDHRSRIYR